MVLRKVKWCTGIDTSNSAAKSDFIALKAEVGKRDINKLFNVTTSLNNSKTKVDDLDVENLKTILVDLSDVVSKEVVKNTIFNKLNTKVNNLENNFSDETTLKQHR